MEEIEILTAVQNLHDDARNGIITIPEDLLFIIYCSNWIISTNYEQIYCFPMRPIHQPHYITLQKDLGNNTIDSLLERALDIN